MEQAVDSGKHIINCDVDPFVPEGWSVEEHRKGGMVEWNPIEASLMWIKQNIKIHEEPGNKILLNANVLDYLLDHPHLIPKEWKDKYICFWGTIYRGRGGLYVRCLYSVGGRWGWYAADSTVSGTAPRLAAVSAGPPAQAGPRAGKAS